VIKLESLTSGGKIHFLRVVTEGGVLGYRSLFSGGPYRASAIVQEDADICLIPKDVVLKVMSDYPEFMMRIVSRLSVELREAESRLESLVDKEAPARVAEAVLYFKEHLPAQTWTRKELAAWAGTTPETVMRVLAKLEEQGLIRQQGRVITIVERQKLLEFADLIE
jgi:CRP-like cAMP-binding protein